MSLRYGYLKLFGFVTVFYSSFIFIKYRINKTRHEAMVRFEDSESGRLLKIGSISFAPKIDYGDPGNNANLVIEQAMEESNDSKKG